MMMIDNRAKIMRVALRLFADHGYAAVGVQQIVDEVGVTKPTLYHYFQSKQGLFEAIMAEKGTPLLTELKQVSTYNHDITHSITQITQFYLDFMQREPTFYRLMLAAWFMPPYSEIYPSVSALHGQMYDLLEALFLNAAQDHGNMQGRHKRYAASLQGMINTYAGLALQGYVQLDDSDIVYRIVHQFMHGIFS
jgi:AcrR family transcriptional regulator